GAGWDVWNLVPSIGAFGIGLGILVFMVNAVRSLRTPATAPGDPWDGRTLEWRTSSPPPAHNFDAIPPVYGRDSFWREKHGPQRTPLAPPVAEHGIHLPAPSHWPIVVACGVFVAAVGAPRDPAPGLPGRPPPVRAATNLPPGAPPKPP